MKDNHYTQYTDYISPQICPLCQKSHPVGKLSGGKVPRYFCRYCLTEFDVIETEDKKILAEVTLYTASGIKAGVKLYKYQKRNKVFAPV